MLKDDLFVGKRMSFCSYPGEIISGDDFYIMSNGLTMLETTNNIFNNTLYKYIKPRNCSSVA